jgi:sodium/hydrogen exchanger 8
MYSFLGTFIAIIASTAMFYGIGKFPFIPDLSFRESFAFSSLISATDPVSVLALFKEMNADINLYSIVFGESIFNDAIGIVMYREIHKSNFEDESIAYDFLQTIISFMIIFIGSFLIGAVSALIIAYLLKRQSRSSQPTNANIEISMMILCPWVSYLIAEGLKMSGIVSVLCNGIFLATYGAPNLTRGSRKVLKLGYETAAYSCETLVFLFLGIGLFAFKHPFIGSIYLIIFTIIILNIARLMNIVITSALVNCCRKRRRLGIKTQFVLWVSGLRGAMAYALAMKSTIDFKHGDMMLVDTLVYALGSVLLIGSILNPLLSYCGVKNNEELQETEYAFDSDGDIPCLEKMKRWLVRFNKSKFAPIFIFADDSGTEGEARELQDVSPVRASELVHQPPPSKDKSASEVKLAENELEEAKLP